MVQQVQYVPVIEGAVPSRQFFVSVEPLQEGDESGRIALAEREAHRHVDILDGLGNGTEHRQQEPLVGKHHGRFKRVESLLRGKLPQQVARHLGLGDAGGDGGRAEGLRSGQRRGERMLRGIGLDIVAQEERRLVDRIGGARILEIPIEIAVEAVADGVQQHLLAGIEGVEPHEDNLAILAQFRHHRLFLLAFVHQRLRHAAVDHSLVAQILRS